MLQQFRLSTSASETYSISVKRNLLCSPEEISSAGLLSADGFCLVVATPTVNRLYGGDLKRTLDQLGANHAWEVLELGEARKDLDAVAGIVDASLKYQMDRNSRLIAFGGGVCSDVCGLAASLIRRGIQHVRIPTTLVGQIDAGIGLKAAVNFAGHKNYVGSFHPPAAVIVDPSVLRSLSAHRTSDGFAEILKVAIVADDPLFRLMQSHGRRLLASRYQEPESVADEVLTRSIGGMVAALSRNPYERTGEPREMDFGHTFSPAIEVASNFSISHGQAVSMDMALSSTIAAELGLLSRDVEQEIVDTLTSLGLPVFHDSLSLALCQDGVARSIKHRGGELNLVIPTRIGACAPLSSREMTSTLIEEAISRLRRL